MVYFAVAVAVVVLENFQLPQGIFVVVAMLDYDNEQLVLMP